MSSLKKSYKLQELKTEYDEFGQLKKFYETLREIEVIVVIKSNKVIENGTEYTLVENLGLTTDKDVKKGMKLISVDDETEYEVNFVNNIARLAQLDLIEVR